MRAEVQTNSTPPRENLIATGPFFILAIIKPSNTLY